MDNQKIVSVDVLYHVNPSLYRTADQGPPEGSPPVDEAVPITIKGVLSHAAQLLSRHYPALLSLGIISGLLEALKLVADRFGKQAGLIPSAVPHLIVAVAGVWATLATIAAFRWCARGGRQSAQSPSLGRTLLSARDVLWPVMGLGLGLLGVWLLVFLPALVSGMIAVRAHSAVLWIPTVLLGLAASAVATVPLAYFSQTISQLVLEPQKISMAWLWARTQLEGRALRAAWLYTVCNLIIVVPDFVKGMVEKLPQLPLPVAVIVPALIAALVFPINAAIDLALFRAFAGPLTRQADSDASPASFASEIA